MDREALEKVIIAQAAEIAELREENKNATKQIKNYVKSMIKTDTENVELRTFKLNLLLEFERALEVIRGNNIPFESDIVVSEYTKGA